MVVMHTYIYKYRTDLDRLLFSPPRLKKKKREHRVHNVVNFYFFLHKELIVHDVRLCSRKVVHEVKNKRPMEGGREAGQVTGIPDPHYSVAAIT